MARHASQPQLKLNYYGIYEIRWTENGRSKRRSTNSSNPDVAQKAFGAWLIKQGSVDAGTLTVSDLIATYFHERIEGGPSSLRTNIIIDTLTRAFGGSKPESLDAAAIMRYERERGEGLHGKRKAAPATVRRELTVLIAALNHAVRQRRIRSDQFPHIDRPEDGDARDVVIPREHMDLIFANATGRLNTFITIAYEAAQRRGAVENLRWRQINMHNRTINFAPSGGSGSKKSVPVPMSTALYDCLMRQPRPETGGGYVLGNNTSAYPAWVALMERLHRLTGDADFLGYVPHDLRRTWATRAAQRGVSLWVIAGVLGDSLAVATKHYAKHQPEHLRSAMQ